MLNRVPHGQINFDPQDLITLFNSCFFDSFNTVLVRGEDEPIYLPANMDSPNHQIVFAHGYFSSGLHEIAHWLVAGPQRRLQEDYGYWYQPDGRNASQQAEFEKVEVAPQAMEWMLSKACGKPFRLSLDNLSGEPTDSKAFAINVLSKVHANISRGLNPRAKLFLNKLCEFYGTPTELMSEDFQLQEIYRD